MRIRRRPPPLDLQSSSISQHIHGYSSSSTSKQDPLIVEGTDVKKPSSTLGKNGCNPTSEMSASGSSTSSCDSFQGHWVEEDKVLPQKKRRSIFQSESRNATAEKTESEKVNATTARRKRVNSKRVVDSDDDYELGAELDCTRKINKSVVRDSSQCRRSNGRGWRCSRPAVEGHSRCEHHLHKTKIDKSIVTDSSRCRRSNGRGWRCSRPAVEGHSRCEHHLHKTGAASKLRVREKNSLQSLSNDKKVNHKVKTRHEIEPPFPQSDVKSCFSNHESKGCSTLIRTTQRCSRCNGRGWRCSETAYEGYSFCEHHLTESRRKYNRAKNQHQAVTSSGYKCDVESCFSNPKSKGSNTLIRTTTQRCSRWNGKEWRCSETAFEGYSFCEHHLTEIRRKNNREKNRHQAVTSSGYKSDVKSCFSNAESKGSSKLIRTTQRCSRCNGKGWRCSETAYEGYSFCEHHLTESRRKYNRAKNRHQAVTSSGFKSDVKSCFSSPKYKGSSTLIHMTQRCSRWNGKEWRCSGPAFEGYSFCEHHLTGSWRKNNRDKIRHQAVTSFGSKSVKMAVFDTYLHCDDEEDDVDFGKNGNVGRFKDRSMSSLLS